LEYQQAEEVLCKMSMVVKNDQWEHYFQSLEEYLQEILMVEGRNGEGDNDSQDPCNDGIEEM
jgi:predicted esterase YcpF (UPF0227 family)